MWYYSIIKQRNGDKEMKNWAEVVLSIEFSRLNEALKTEAMNHPKAEKERKQHLLMLVEVKDALFEMSKNKKVAA